MRIAVSYEAGRVHHRFGSTPAFKFYEVEGGRVVSSSVEKNAARGHDAVIAYLESKGIDVLISGEVCECGRQRMFDQDIEIYSGVDGQADGRVTDCLAGRKATSTSASVEDERAQDPPPGFQSLRGTVALTKGDLSAPRGRVAS